MGAVAKAENTQVAIHDGGQAAQGSALIPRSFDEVVRFAEIMSRGKMMPAHLQGSPGDCFMVVEQAMRWNMSPFAVAQCTSSIQGKLMFEGKLIAAAIETSGALSGLLDYTFSGSGQDRMVTVSGKRRGETTTKTVDVVLKDVVTNNGIWKKQPDQQLVYSGARIWGRRWTPGVVLGVYAPEEFDGVTITHQPAPEPQRVTSQRPPAAEIPALDAPPAKRTASMFLDELETRVRACTERSQVEAIVDEEEVQRAQGAFKNGMHKRLCAILQEGLTRLTVRAADDGDGWPGPDVPAKEAA